jgi:UDP-N-acetylmuramyl pentapeptide phosphotransferase/UDP-N-acetylglucosamine-1-phosphate transferase
MPLLPALLCFLAIAAASFFMVGRIRGWLLSRQILDIPNQRSSHAVPTPRGGGLAVVILVLLTALIWTLATQNWRQGLVFSAAGLVVAIVGWMDDVRSLPARLRFLVQGLASLLCILGLGYFHSIHIPLLGELRLGWVGLPVTLLWIIGLTNAFNFMDGIDGITGGVAAAGGLGWMILSVLTSGLRSDLAFWLALAVTAASIGFLGHNWHPARIFAGDVCSTFLGFTFAVLPLLSSDAGGDAFLVGTAVLWVYILDTGLTFLRRLIRGEAVFSAHRTHLYQRLVISGLPVPLVSGLYITLTLAGAALALGWMLRLEWVPALLLPGMPLAWAALFWYTRRVRKA